MGGSQSYSTPKYYRDASSDMASQNAALFERIQRSRAYGVQQTRLVGNTGNQTKSTLGG
jgi:hypothetical protein